MSGQSKPPKSPFNFASGAWDKDQAAKYDQEQGLNDKDNAANRFDPPSQNQNPAPNLAPPGMSGRSGKPSKKPEEIFISFTPDNGSNSRKVDISKDAETIEYPMPDGKNALIKQTHSRSSEGEEIENISRLTIFDENQEGVDFRDKGWLQEPKTRDELENVEFLEDRFGKLEEERFKSFDDMNKDSEIDHDI